MWVEFVVGSLGAVFFSNHSGFFHPKKSKKYRVTCPNFNLIMTEAVFSPGFCLGESQGPLC